MTSPFAKACGAEVEVSVPTQDCTINMGPQHPATHGVMRLLLKADGEVLTGAQAHLGYLHRCAEKIGENVDWTQYLPYTDRYDYLSAMNNNLGYSLAVEKLMGLEVPERAQWMRVLLVELNRIASHLFAVGAYGLDLGAFTPLFYTLREREEILDLFEKICGARLTCTFIRLPHRRHGRASRGFQKNLPTPSPPQFFDGRRSWPQEDASTLLGCRGEDFHHVSRRLVGLRRVGAFH